MKLNLKDILESIIHEEDSEATQQAHDLGLVSKGWGKWADPNTGEVVAKTIHGTLVKIDPKGYNNPDSDEEAADLVRQGLPARQPPKPTNTTSPEQSWDGGARERDTERQGKGTVGPNPDFPQFSDDDRIKAGLKPRGSTSNVVRGDPNARPAPRPEKKPELDAQDMWWK